MQQEVTYIGFVPGQLQLVILREMTTNRRIKPAVRFQGKK